MRFIGEFMCSIFSFGGLSCSDEFLFDICIIKLRIQFLVLVIMLICCYLFCVKTSIIFLRSSKGGKVGICGD